MFCLEDSSCGFSIISGLSCSFVGCIWYYVISRVLSGDKFCVTSGNLGAGQVFVASGNGESGGGNGIFG